MQQTILQEYAKLIATMGVNVQPGQEVIIEAELDQPEFVTELVKACYEAGARAVRVDWQHQPVALLHALHRSPEALGEMREWEKTRLQDMVDTLPCRIYLESEDPDGMKDADPAKISAAAQNRQRIAKPYRDQMENRIQWCIAAVPGKSWAAKLFPELPVEEAMEKLWEAILEASRAKGDGPANWQAHNADLTARCRYLNSLGIRSLQIGRASCRERV